MEKNIRIEMDSGFDEVDKRFEKMDKKLDQLENKDDRLIEDQLDIRAGLRRVEKAVFEKAA